MTEEELVEKSLKEIRDCEFPLQMIGFDYAFKDKNQIGVTSKRRAREVRSMTDDDIRNEIRRMMLEVKNECGENFYQFV